MRRIQLRKGISPLETIFASATLLLIAMIFMLMVGDVVKLVWANSIPRFADAAANRAIEDLSITLQTAMLPLQPRPTTPSRPVIDEVFCGAAIERSCHVVSKEWGDKWLARLRQGSDAIALVHHGDGNGGDGDGPRLPWTAPDGDVPLDGKATAAGGGTPSTEDGPGEYMTLRQFLDPDWLLDPATEAIDFAAQQFGWWWQRKDRKKAMQCWLSVIRFVPVLRDGVPLVIEEKEIMEQFPGVDLDGDGRTDGCFHIGRLQHLHLGFAPSAEAERAARAGTKEEMPKLLRQLTPNIVLRHAREADRAPIFRLVEREVPVAGSSRGGAFSQGEGLAMALTVRMLLLDSESVRVTDDGRILRFSGSTSQAAHWYETVVEL